jgi:hypothetical protein
VIRAGVVGLIAAAVLLPATAAASPQWGELAAPLVRQHSLDESSVLRRGAAAASRLSETSSLDPERGFGAGPSTRE